jgi:hypothetical protein
MLRKFRVKKESIEKYSDIEMFGENEENFYYKKSIKWKEELFSGLRKDFLDDQTRGDINTSIKAAKMRIKTDINKRTSTSRRNSLCISFKRRLFKTRKKKKNTPGCTCSFVNICFYSHFKRDT